MRDLVVLSRRNASSSQAPTTLAGVTGWVDTREADHVEPIAPVLDLPHRSPDARRRFGARGPIAIAALAWLEPEAELPAAWSGAYVESFRFSVRGHLGWPAKSDAPADPADVVKQVSFLHATDGYGEARFRDHYRHHVEIAGRHMPALWQYVQNDVVAVRGAGSDGSDAAAATGVVAISELWFRTTDDFLNRYFPSEQDRREFSAHEDFLDLSRATSFVCASHVRAADGPATPERAV